MLCHQQQHQLRHILVAFTRLRTTWLGCSADVLLSNKSTWTILLPGPKTGQPNAMPITATPCLWKCTPHRRLSWQTWRLVSPTLSSISWRKPFGSHHWVWRSVECHSELYATAKERAEGEEGGSSNDWHEHTFRHIGCKWDKEETGTSSAREYLYGQHGQRS